jgi:hypothetical protein
MHDKKSMTEKNASPLRAISMAMTRCDAKHIARFSMSRATLDATGHHHWASIRPISLRRTPWSSIFGLKKLWRCEIAFGASVKTAQNSPTTQLIKATSCVERSNATIKAEELSFLSSYHTLTTDKNC